MIDTAGGIGRPVGQDGSGAARAGAASVDGGATCQAFFDVGGRAVWDFGFHDEGAFAVECG